MEDCKQQEQGAPPKSEQKVASGRTIQESIFQTEQSGKVVNAESFNAGEKDYERAKAIQHVPYGPSFDTNRNSDVKKLQAHMKKRCEPRDFIVVPNNIGLPKPFGHTKDKIYSRTSSQRDHKIIRLPLFASRTSINSGLSASTGLGRKSQVSSATLFDLEEMEYALQEKARHRFRELRHNFIINDPEGLGNLSREAFARTLSRLLYRPVGQKLVARLLMRMGFPKNKQVISFPEFYSALTFGEGMRPGRTAGSMISLSSRSLTQIKSTHPRCSKSNPERIKKAKSQLALEYKPGKTNELDEKNGSTKPWAFLTQLPRSDSSHKHAVLAHQVMAVLRRKLQERSMRPEDLMHCAEVKEVPVIERTRLSAQLIHLGFRLSEAEFLRLWRRFQPENKQYVPAESILRHLYLDSPLFLPGTDNTRDVKDHPQRKLRRKEPSADQLCPWLLERFRKGLRKILKAVWSCQTSADGGSTDVPKTQGGLSQITPEVFSSALKKLNMQSLDKRQLVLFLKRYNLSLNAQGYFPLQELLRCFQDRSETGVAHQLFASTIIPSIPEGLAKARLSENNETAAMIKHLELELIVRMHREFLQLLSTFRESDVDRQGSIDPGRFRIALKKHFRFEYSDHEFADILDRLPLTESGKVLYGELMRHFDSTATSLNSLFEKTPVILALDSAEGSKTRATDQLLEKPFEKFPGIRAKHRSLKELHQIIRKSLLTHMREAEQNFREMDKYNSGRMNQEELHEFLKSLKIAPEITRGEIRDLWPTLFVNTKQTLDFYEFERHFLYSKADLCFPNAKLIPPRLGDADLMPCSKRLNGVTALIKDSLRSKIELMFEPLHKEFVAMDPGGTGYISREHFEEILTELCLNISDREVEELMEKFDLKKNGNISYNALLQPFATKRRRWATLRMLNELPRSRPKTYKNQPLKSTTAQLLTNLRTKKQMSHLRWSKLRRSMQKADHKGSGRLDAPVFRNLFQEATGVRLTDEQVYQLLTSLDPEISGTLPYTRLLEEAEQASKHTPEQTEKVGAEVKNEITENSQ